jgi:hypothetical protein
MHGHAQDSSTARPPAVRATIRFEEDGSWTALRGAILLATGLPTAAAAWEVIDQVESSRASGCAPARPPAITRRARR